MTVRLFLVLVNTVLSIAFFLAALAARDAQKRQTRLMFAIWFALSEIAQVLNAIAIHTGAFPLWNNK